MATDKNWDTKAEGSDTPPESTTHSSSGKSKRGFASMDENRQREIASKGGKAAHEKGTAHEFDSAEGAAAGRKGGQARQNNIASATDDTGSNENIGGDLLDDSNL